MLAKRFGKKISTKLQPKYYGTYVILEQFDNGTYKIKQNNKVTVVTEEQLKLYLPTNFLWEPASSFEKRNRQPSKAGRRVERQKTVCKNKMIEDQPLPQNIASLRLLSPTPESSALALTETTRNLGESVPKQVHENGPPQHILNSESKEAEPQDKNQTIVETSN